jgi:hypothetical protein
MLWPGRIATCIAAQAQAEAAIVPDRARNATCRSLIRRKASQDLQIV